MKQEKEMKNELEKLKNAPQYIDLFCNIMRQRLGDDQGIFREVIDEAMAYYKNPMTLEIYTKLVHLRLEETLMHGKLNDTIDIGEETLSVFNKESNLEGSIVIYEKLMFAYMNKGLFKKANDYRLKAIAALSTLQEVKQKLHVKVEHSLDIQTLGDEVKGINQSNTMSGEADYLEPIDGTLYEKLYISVNLSIIKFYILLKEYKKAKKLLLHIEDMTTWLTPEQIQQVLVLALEIDLVENNIDQAIKQMQALQNLLGEDQSAQSCVQINSLRLRAILNRKRSLHMQADRDFKSADSLGEHNQEAQIQNLMSWSDYLVDEEKLDEAYAKITRAIKIAGRMKSSYFLVQSYERLTHIYEKKKQWELGYKALQQLNKYQAKIEEVQIEKDSSSTKNAPIEALSSVYSEQMTNDYKRSYEHLEQIARLGKVLSSEQSISQLPATIHKEIAPLIDLDVMGIAMINQGKVDYSMYELSGKWLSLDNDIVRYTSRLVDYSTQFHADIIVNDGNFEEYTIKHIINSESNVQLQSMIVFILKVENNMLGAMTLGSYKSNAYSQKDIAVARILASYLGLMLKNIHLYQKIDYLSDHDVLTGVLSRQIILKKGEKLFKENHKKGRNTAIIILETDLFKRLNTKYGYELGNEILSKIGKTIKESVSQKDDVGRYDDKAFIAILDHLSAQEATQLAEKIKENVERLTFETKKEQQIKVTLSGGIYICNEYTLSFDDAIQFANHALYRAKLLGRNCIMSYSLGDKK